MNRSFTKVISLLTAIMLILTSAVFTAAAEEPDTLSSAEEFREGTEIISPSEQVLSDPDLTQRITDGAENDSSLLNSGIDEKEETENYPADGNWKWQGKITLVAQSASKVYDGTPLEKPTDVLVEGLPEEFYVKTTVSGSLTDAGSCDNVITDYAIYNNRDEDVTSHFENIETVSGMLVVDPAPLTVWTGSAEKVYDGQELTSRRATVKAVPWYSSLDMPLRNSAAVVETEEGSKMLIAVCGKVRVQIADPLTGEPRQITLDAGQQLTVSLLEKEGEEEISLTTVALREKDLPVEVLRLYAEMPDLLDQACADAKWSRATLKKLIANLPNEAGSGVEMISDCVTLGISIASETEGGSRFLTGDELSFTSLSLDPSITVTATGRQKEIGSSKNTYKIDWGNAKSSNYKIYESLGTLTVLDPGASDNSDDSDDSDNPDKPQEYTGEVVLTAGSDQKVFDGKALTCETVDVSGLPDDYTAEPTFSGSQTEAGTSENKITGYRILDPDGKDVTKQFTNVKTVSGTLTVDKLGLSIDCGGCETVYNGNLYFPDSTVTYTNGPHKGEKAASTRVDSSINRFSLYTGDTLETEIDGMGIDADAYTLTCAASFVSGSAANYTVSTTGKELIVNQTELIIEVTGAKKEYDGTALTAGSATVTGLAAGDTITVNTAGSQTGVGKCNITYTIDWKNTNRYNYKVTDNLGELEVTQNTTHITITAGSANKNYDGTELTTNEFTVAGLPSGFTVEASVSGSQTNVGSSPSTIASYAIKKGNEDVTAYFSSVETVNGTLTVSARISHESGWTLVTYGGSYYRADVLFESLLYSMRNAGHTDEEIIQYALNEGVIHAWGRAISFLYDLTVVKCNGREYKVLDYAAFMKFINDNPSMSDALIIKNAANAGLISPL